MFSEAIIRNTSWVGGGVQESKKTADIWFKGEVNHNIKTALADLKLKGVHQWDGRDSRTKWRLNTKVGGQDIIFEWADAGIYSEDGDGWDQYRSW